MMHRLRTVLRRNAALLTAPEISDFSAISRTNRGCEALPQSCLLHQLPQRSAILAESFR